MTSSPQNNRLQLWNFSNTEGHDATFPNSYNDYQNLLVKAGDKSYNQDDKKNLINLQYVFDTAINESGLGNVIVDVEKSKSSKKIEKARVTSQVDEVIVVNKLSNGKKSLVGLFRGMYYGGDKNGFSLFGSNKKCMPYSTNFAQIAYFPSEYFAEFKRKKGMTDIILSTIFSEYSESNRLNYIFYRGLVDTNNDSIYRRGAGSMLRKLPYGGYEIIQGTWGGGVEVSDGKYSDEFNDVVSDASAFRISNDGTEKIEGIAIGGNWYKGRFMGGTCLSWRLNFGSDEVFNYTGSLLSGKSMPSGWGVLTFYNINIKNDIKIESLMGNLMQSLVIRSFTVPNETKNENENDADHNDTGISISFSSKNVSMSDNSRYLLNGQEPVSVYVGEFTQSKFLETGYGVEIFFDGGNIYIYIGSVTRGGYKYGILYTLTPKSTSIPASTASTASTASSASTFSENSNKCENFLIESEIGKFSTSPISKNSKSFKDDHYSSEQGMGSTKQSDQGAALISTKTAISTFSSIKSRCFAELEQLVQQKINTAFGVSAIMSHDHRTPTNLDKCIYEEYHRLMEYKQYVDSMFLEVQEKINYVIACGKSKLQTQPLGDPMATPMGTPVVGTTMETGTPMASPMGTPMASPVATLRNTLRQRFSNNDTNFLYDTPSSSSPQTPSSQLLPPAQSPQLHVQSLPQQRQKYSSGDFFGFRVRNSLLNTNRTSPATSTPFTQGVYQQQPQQLPRANSGDSSAFQGQQQSFMQQSQQPSNQQQSQYHPLINHYFL